MRGGEHFSTSGKDWGKEKEANICLSIGRLLVEISDVL